jgi:hypothetical protein
MQKLIIFGVAAAMSVAAQVKGAQVFVPPATGELASVAVGSAGATAGWATNILYVRDGTARPRVALRSRKDVSELDIGDIATGTTDFASVEGMRLDGLGDPLIGESLGKLRFTRSPASAPPSELLAIAWLFGIGLIGIATVGRRKKP